MLRQHEGFILLRQMLLFSFGDITGFAGVQYFLAVDISVPLIASPLYMLDRSQ